MAGALRAALVGPAQPAVGGQPAVAPVATIGLGPALRRRGRQVRASEHVELGGAPVVGDEVGSGDSTGGHGPIGQAEDAAELGNGGGDGEEGAVGALGAGVQGLVGHRVLHRPAAVAVDLLRVGGAAVEEHLYAPSARLNSLT